MFCAKCGKVVHDEAIICVGCGSSLKRSNLKHYVRTENSDTKGFSHFFSEISSEDLSKKVHNLLNSNGYKLKDGNVGNGVYEKGNRIARILLGGFNKYFKWKIQTEKSGSEALIKVVRKSSGMSGGLIGMNQVKKELNNLFNSLLEL